LIAEKKLQVKEQRALAFKKLRQRGRDLLRRGKEPPSVCEPQEDSTDESSPLVKKRRKYRLDSPKRRKPTTRTGRITPIQPDDSDVVIIEKQSSTSEERGGK
jgi:hypothetical protein